MSTNVYQSCTKCKKETLHSFITAMELQCNICGYTYTVSKKSPIEKTIESLVDIPEVEVSLNKQLEKPKPKPVARELPTNIFQTDLPVQGHLQNREPLEGVGVKKQVEAQEKYVTKNIKINSWADDL